MGVVITISNFQKAYDLGELRGFEEKSLDLMGASVSALWLGHAHSSNWRGWVSGIPSL